MIKLPSLSLGLGSFPLPLYMLISGLIWPPVPSCSDFEKAFILQTDASNYKVGAVLSQTDVDGLEECPIAYFSHKLLDQEYSNKFDNRFARQHRYGPPPEFPQASSYWWVNNPMLDKTAGVTMTLLR